MLDSLVRTSYLASWSYFFYKKRRCAVTLKHFTQVRIIKKKPKRDISYT
uniref:Uncharacterized protein n=1 Tax=Arundo donax TaxID=35708 RepID=A0A0A8Y208_ARUDO